MVLIVILKLPKCLEFVRLHKRIVLEINVDWRQRNFFWQSICEAVHTICGSPRYHFVHLHVYIWSTSASPLQSYMARLRCVQYMSVRQWSQCRGEMETKRGRKRGKLRGAEICARSVKRQTTALCVGFHFGLESWRDMAKPSWQGLRAAVGSVHWL